MSTPEPRHSTDRVDFSGSAEEFEALCAARDKKHASSRTRRTVALLLLGLALLVLLLGAMSTSTVFLPTGGVLLLVAIITIALNGGDQLEERKFSIPRTLLAAIGPELEARRPVSVTIDFRIHTFYKKGEPWLEVKVPLDNGVTAQLLGRVSCKQKQRQKRKYTKITQKIVETFVIRLSPPKGQSLGAERTVGPKDRPIGALWLRRARIAPRAATFMFSTDTIVRRHGRWGWDDSYGGMPADYDVVQALVVAYHLMEHEAARAQASP